MIEILHRSRYYDNVYCIWFTFCNLLGPIYNYYEIKLRVDQIYGSCYHPCAIFMPLDKVHQIICLKLTVLSI